MFLTRNTTVRKWFALDRLLVVDVVIDALISSPHRVQLPRGVLCVTVAFGDYQPKLFPLVKTKGAGKSQDQLAEDTYCNHTSILSLS